MKKGISQEGLKLIACGCMLLDHIGAAVFPSTLLRIIGRLAFPIYCFLLAEGVFRTANPKRYALRLCIGALLSELPFDLLFFGELTWQHQNVMFTLLTAFVMMRLMLRREDPFQRILIMLPFILLAQLLRTDYGGYGVALAGIFLLCRQKPQGFLLSTLLSGLLFLAMPGTAVFGIPLQLFAVGAMLPICMYSGRKRSSGPAVQWAFYLFYPIHLLVLAGFF